MKLKYLLSLVLLLIISSCSGSFDVDENLLNNEIQHNFTIETEDKIKVSDEKKKLIECSSEYNPVCGQPRMPKCPEGLNCAEVMPVFETYENICYLNKSGAEFLYDGVCKINENNSYLINLSLGASKELIIGPYNLNISLNNINETIIDLEIVENFKNSIAGPFYFLNLMKNTISHYNKEITFKVVEISYFSTQISYAQIEFFFNPVLDEPCSSEYNPVCGQPRMPKCPEGLNCAEVMPVFKTYENICYLNKFGAEFLYDGVCKEIPEFPSLSVSIEDKKIAIPPMNTGSQYSPWLMGRPGWESVLMYRCKNNPINNIWRDRIWRSESWGDAWTDWVGDQIAIDGTIENDSRDLVCSPGVFINPNDGVWHMYYVSASRGGNMILYLQHATAKAPGQKNDWIHHEPIKGFAPYKGDLNKEKAYLETPSPIWKNNKLELYFVGENSNLFKMESYDGFNFSNPVKLNAPLASHGRITYHEGTYYYAYSISSKGRFNPPNQIYLASSYDGINFKNSVLIMESYKSNDTWDNGRIFAPQIWFNPKDSKDIRLYYAANTNENYSWWGSKTAIGVLKLSLDNSTIETCSNEYKPVCGKPIIDCVNNHYACSIGEDCPVNPCSDIAGIATTYDNICYLEKAGAEFLYDGKCKITELPNFSVKVEDKKIAIDPIFIGSQFSPWVMSRPGWNGTLMYMCKNILINDIWRDRVWRMISRGDAWTDWDEGQIVVDGVFGSDSRDLVCSPGIFINPKTNVWHMYYVSSSRSKDTFILYLQHATSKVPGINWTNHGPLEGFAPYKGPHGSKEPFLETPSPIWKGDKLELYFVGEHNNLYKMESLDGFNFTNPVKLNAPVASHGRVTYHDGIYYYAYSINPKNKFNGPTHLYLTFSLDGLNFKNKILLHDVSKGDDWELGRIRSPQLWFNPENSDDVRLYYAANGENLATTPGGFRAKAAIGVLKLKITKN